MARGPCAEKVQHQESATATPERPQIALKRSCSTQTFPDMLRRLPLASLVCPTTPFLAPRLLCTPTSLAGLSARCGTASAGLQRSTYATKGTKWRIRDPKKALRKDSQLDPSAERRKHSGSRAPVDEVGLFTSHPLMWPVASSLRAVGISGQAIS